MSPEFPMPGYPSPGLPGRPPEFTPPGFPRRSPFSPPPPIPQVPSQAEDVFASLLRHRIVLLTGTLDARTMTETAAQLMLLDASGDDPIELRLMCPGGDLDAALALADTIDLLGVELRATAAGTVGGPALGPFVAGTRRLAHPHATFVLRDPEMSVTGRAEDFALAVANYGQQLDALHHRLATASRQRLERVKEDMGHGLVLSAAGARDYGLVDDLV